jgi:hypothetical protein
VSLSLPLRRNRKAASPVTTAGALPEPEAIWPSTRVEPSCSKRAAGRSTGAGPLVAERDRAEPEARKYRRPLFELTDTVTTTGWRRIGAIAAPATIQPLVTARRPRFAEWLHASLPQNPLARNALAGPSAPFVIRELLVEVCVRAVHYRRPMDQSWNQEGDEVLPAPDNVVPSVGRPGGL